MTSLEKVALSKVLMGTYKKLSKTPRLAAHGEALENEESPS